MLIQLHKELNEKGFYLLNRSNLNYDPHYCNRFHWQWFFHSISSDKLPAFNPVEWKLTNEISVITQLSYIL